MHNEISVVGSDGVIIVVVDIQGHSYIVLLPTKHPNWAGDIFR